MSDNLRDRIAKTLYRECSQQAWVGRAYGISFADLADAVIAELGLRQEWVTRHESGGGRIHSTRADAFHRLNTFVPRPPGVEDPGSGELIGVESRYVTPWKLA